MVPLSAETKPQATRGKNNMNKDQARSTFEAVYNSLKKPNNMTLPQSMNRITSNGNVKSFLVKHHGLVKEIL
jgi:hypothetical protein